MDNLTAYLQAKTTQSREFFQELIEEVLLHLQLGEIDAEQFQTRILAIQDSFTLKTPLPAQLKLRAQALYDELTQLNLAFEKGLINEAAYKTTLDTLLTEFEKDPAQAISTHPKPK